MIFLIIICASIAVVFFLFGFWCGMTDFGMIEW